MRPLHSAVEVVTIAPDSDMAVLRVKDPSLWKDVGPLKVNRKVRSAHTYLPTMLAHDCVVDCCFPQWNTL